MPSMPKDKLKKLLMLKLSLKAYELISTMLIRSESIGTRRIVRSKHVSKNTKPSQIET
jgi:hypothetical protein